MREIRRRVKLKGLSLAISCTLPLAYLHVVIPPHLFQRDPKRIMADKAPHGGFHAGCCWDQSRIRSTPSRPCRRLVACIYLSRRLRRRQDLSETLVRVIDIDILDSYSQFAVLLLHASFTCSPWLKRHTVQAHVKAADYLNPTVASISTPHCLFLSASPPHLVPAQRISNMQGWRECNAVFCAFVPCLVLRTAALRSQHLRCLCRVSMPLKHDG